MQGQSIPIWDPTPGLALCTCLNFSCLPVPLHLLPNNTHLKPPRTRPKSGVVLSYIVELIISEVTIYSSPARTRSLVTTNLRQCIVLYGRGTRQPLDLNRFICPVLRSQSRGSACPCAPHKSHREPKLESAF